MNHSFTPSVVELYGVVTGGWTTGNACACPGSKPASRLCRVNKPSGQTPWRVAGFHPKENLPILATTSSFRHGPPCSPDARSSQTRRLVGSVKKTHAQNTLTGPIKKKTYTKHTQLCFDYNRYCYRVQLKKRPRVGINRKDMLGCELLDGGVRLLLESQSGFTFTGIRHRHLRRLQLFAGRKHISHQ